jgi:hypothetical protein
MESVEIKPVNTMITFKVYEIKIDAEYRFNINKRHKYPKILLVFLQNIPKKANMTLASSLANLCINTIVNLIN